MCSGQGGLPGLLRGSVREAAGEIRRAQNAPRLVRDESFADLAVPDGREQLRGAEVSARRAGHREVGARVGGFHGLARTGPVRDDAAQEAEVVLDDVKQARVGTGVRTVDLVCAGHDAEHAGIDGGLETRQIYFAQRAFADDLVHLVTIELLVVADEVFRVRDHALVLRPAHERRRQPGVQQRVFRKILEVPAVERVADDVDRRRLEQVRFTRARLRRHRARHALDQFRFKGRRLPGDGGEKRADARLIAAAPVVHDHGPDAETVDRGGPPVARGFALDVAVAQLDLLLQRHPGENRLDRPLHFRSDVGIVDGERGSRQTEKENEDEWAGHAREKDNFVRAGNEWHNVSFAALACVNSPVDDLRSTMNPSSIGFGFVGTGEIAAYSAAEVQKHPQGRLVAAHDLSADRLHALCARFGIPKAYATAAELFADPAVDAVYIAVPNRYHAPLTIQALEAGKHVILDKPFAMNLAEAEQVAATAARVGRVVMLGMNNRFGRSAQVTKALVERGDLGEIYHAKAFWQRRTGIPKLGTWFGNKNLAGAGCLYDIGVHVLDLALYLIDDFKPVAVSAATYTKFGHLGLGAGNWGKSDREGLPFDVDDFATGLIRFENGATLSLDVAWACHTEQGNRFDVQLYGTKAGALAMEGKMFRPDPETGEYLVIQGPNLPIRYPHTERFHNFINHLLGSEELCVSIEQALAVQKILDAMFHSASTGQEVRL